MEIPRLLALLILSTCLGAIETMAEDPIEPFIEARQAFRDGGEKQLWAISKSMESHILFPYIEYWRIRLRIRELTKDKFDQVLKNDSRSLVGNKLRRDWLIELARRKQWPDFILYFKDLQNKDTAVICLKKIADHSLGTNIGNKEVRKIWLNPRSQPKSCTPLFKILFEENILNSKDIWQRVRLALEVGNLSIARAALSYLPRNQIPNGWILNKIKRNPERFLNIKAKTKAEREFLIFAIYKTATKSLGLALRKLESINSHLSADERSYAWGQLGLIAALSHNTKSLQLFAQVPPNNLNTRQKAWKARAYLREEKWTGLLKTIKSMQRLQRNKDVWQYWRGYAKCQIRQTHECHKIMIKVSKRNNYYGSLARIFVNLPDQPLQRDTKIEEHTKNKLMNNLSLRTALYFFKHGQRYQGALEWEWAIKSFSDSDLIGAAKIAYKKRWYKKAIFTLNKSEALKDYSLKYPTPYFKIVDKYSGNLGLPVSWVFGLIRQESRFSSKAQSPAGAIGLMQLMPLTAKSMSNSLGTRYSRVRLYNPDTNVFLGASYLDKLLKKLKHPVLATAAYNAGPRRALSWRAKKELLPAIFIESIPISETRNYVKSVLHNTIRYGQILKTSKFGKKTLLDMVPGK